MQEIIVNKLKGIGYTDAEAEMLYRKYNDWGKLDELNEYLEAKTKEIFYKGVIYEL